MSDHFGNIPIQQPESPPPEPTNVTRKPPRARSITKKAGKKPSSPFKSAFLGLFSILTIIFTSYCALGFWGVPYYLTKILPEQFQEKTGMVLAPTTVSFNPFTFMLETGQVVIRSKEAKPMVSLASLITEIAPIPLLRKSTVLKSITLNKLDLDISRQQDGSYDVQQLFGAEGKTKIPALSDLTDLTFSYSLNNISISDANIKLTDVPSGKVHTVEKIQLDLPTIANISLDVKQFLRPHFSAIVNGSPIELSNQTKDLTKGEDGVTKLSLNIQEFDLSQYAGYLPIDLPMQISKGKADGKISLLYNPNNIKQDKLTVGFQLALSEVELNRTAQRLTLSIPASLVKGSFQPTSKKLLIADLTLKEPRLNFIGKSLLTDIWQRNAQSEDSIHDYQLSITRLLIDKGQISVYASQKEKQATSTWENFQVAIQGYHDTLEADTKTGVASFSISGEQKGSNANFSWQGNLSGRDIFSGELILQKFKSETLLNGIDTGLPFSISGLTDLRGQLTLSPPQKGSDHLNYKLVAGRVSIDKFSLADSGKKQPIIRAELAQFSPVNFEDQHLNLGKIELEKGDAFFFYNQPPKAFTTLDTKKLRFKELSYQGSVQFSPAKHQNRSLNLIGVSLKATKLDGSSQAGENLIISGKTAKGANLKARGLVNLTPFSVELKTEIHNFVLQEVLPFFTKATVLTGVSGFLSGNGKFTLPAKNFSGKLQLSKLTNNSSKNNSYSWGNSVFQDLDYRSKPFQFKAKAVQIDQAKITWKINRKSKEPMSAFSDFLTNLQPTSKEKSTSDKSASDSSINLQQISFRNSTIDIYDLRAEPTWQSKLENFSGEINHLDSTAVSQKSNFSFNGILDGSSVAIDGEMSPFSKKQQANFHVSLESYPLASFYKQLSGKIELDLSKGELDMMLESSWQNNTFVSRGHLDLRQLAPLDSASDQALPLALLTDSKGNLRQSFNFSRQSPVGRISLVDQLFSLFQTRLIKGSVSPLLLANGDFTDLIDNEIIEFRPGEFVLSDEGRKILTRYTALLISHPNIGLVLSGGVNPQKDRVAMEQRLKSLEQQRVEHLNEVRFKQWEEKKAVYEEELRTKQAVIGPDGKIVEQDIPPEILAGFQPIHPAPISVEDDMLVDLAKSRLDIILQYFTAQLSQEAERVSISEEISEIQNVSSSGNGVSISLKAIQR